MMTLASLGLTTRSFLFVPYGEPVSPSISGPTICCDGRVVGSTLELTHWTDNETPRPLYADTSTECALRLALACARGEYAAFSDATVLNNHFDTDGVLSVWACLEPAEALRHAELLCEGAEAGDFGEWSSDRGVQLDAAIEAIGGGVPGGEGAAKYEAALALLPALLEDLALHKALWRDGFEEATAGWAALLDGRATLSRTGGIALLTEPSSLGEEDGGGGSGGGGGGGIGGGGRLAAAALHRGIALGFGEAACTRVLRVRRDGARYRYEYETPGHGWVRRLTSTASSATAPLQGSA